MKRNFWSGTEIGQRQGTPAELKQKIIRMVFCYQNCSDILWEKNCSSDSEKLSKFNAGGGEPAKILRSLEQFIQTEKGQNNIW